jgi:nitrogen regulatory protein PII/signal recognition particle receptor subunit beta
MNKTLKNINIIILSNSNTDKPLLSEYFNNERFINRNITFSIFDYRKITIDEEENYLLNSPGNSNFKSIEQILYDNIDGIIVFIEANAGLEETDLEIMDLIATGNIPQILMVNRSDLDDIEMTFSVEGILMVPTMIKEEIGIDSGLKMLLKLIDKKNTIQEEEYKKTSTTNKTDLERSEFIKVRLFFHPIELDNVKKSLEHFGFSNLTIIDIKYQDRLIEKTETYRCSIYEVKLPPKIEMIMIIKKEEIDYVIQAIQAIKTEDISKKIFLSPVEDVIRIRTTERGEKAID